MKEIFTMDLKGKLLIAVVFMVLGFMLSVQYKTTELQRNVRMDRVEDLSERLKIMEAENKQLLTELSSISVEIAQMVVSGEDNKPLPDWFLVELVRELPALVKRRNST